MKVLLTGAAGFIGSHLADLLVRRGDAVTGIDNFDPYYDPAIKKRNVAEVMDHAKGARGTFTFRELDFTSETHISAELEQGGYEAVIHLAAQAGVRPSIVDPQKYVRVNVLGVVTLLEAMRRHGPNRILAASSSAVYGDVTRAPFKEDAPCSQPLSPYGASKRAGESFLGAYSALHGMQVTIVRPFTVYGPRQRPDMAIASFLRKLLAGQELVLFGDGTSARDYTYVEDIASGLAGALDRPQAFAIFNLGNDHPTSLNELIEMMQRVAGKKAHVRHAPRAVGDVEKTWADLSCAREQIGYAPKTSLENGLLLTLDWVRSELSGR